jgi:hypothetical protein
LVHTSDPWRYGLPQKKGSARSSICKHHGFIYVIGLEAPEDLTDLRKAIEQEFIPDDVYSPCPCGSGRKFKFCCAKKPIEAGI